MNLRWSWDPRAVELFRWVDSDAWERSGHDPVQMLGLITRQRFEELAEDRPFMSFLAAVDEDLKRYLNEPRWFQTRKGDSGVTRVAYFSPEFGVSEALPIYSGGLGCSRATTSKRRAIWGSPRRGGPSIARVTSVNS